MKKLLLKLLLLVAPGALLLLLQVVLPPNTFTFRAWEALGVFSARFPTPFFPNQDLRDTEVGDLAPYTQDAVPNHVRFATDDLGYRNAAACPAPLGIVVGDSMAAGSALTQEDTLSEQLSRRLGECVRSFGGGTADEALRTAYARLGLRPRFVVLVLSQRTAGRITAFHDPKMKWGIDPTAQPAARSAFAHYTQMRKNLYWNFRARHGVVAAIERPFATTEGRTRQIAPTGGEHAQMKFYEDDWKRRVTDAEMDGDRRALTGLAADLSRSGALLVLAIVPNKSTIYPGPFEDQDRDFIDRYAKAVGEEPAFTFVDLFTPYREDFEERGVRSHHLDDTHWNAHGVETLVNRLCADSRLRSIVACRPTDAAPQPE